MQKLTALFATLLLSLSAVAAANDDPTKTTEDRSSGADAEFTALDRNDDDRISKSEAEEDENLSAQFASVDADNDGYVTESEYDMSSTPEEFEEEPLQ